MIKNNYLTNNSDNPLERYYEYKCDKLKEEMYNIVSYRNVCGGSNRIVKKKNVVKIICNDIVQNIVVKLQGNDSLVLCREFNFS